MFIAYVARARKEEEMGGGGRGGKERKRLQANLTILKKTR